MLEFEKCKFKEKEFIVLNKYDLNFNETSRLKILEKWILFEVIEFILE